jgi:Flp pilus assembly protein TadG
MVIKQKEEGQGLVEFALILMVLILVVFGVLDLGRAFHSLITITNASREGARYLTRHPTDKELGFAGTKNAAIDEADGAIIVLTPDQVAVTLCLDEDAISGCDSGTPVRVEVTYSFEFMMGFFSQASVPLTQATEMIVP